MAVETKPVITETDIQIARSGPAIYSNRVIINMDHIVRLAFVEQTADGPLFRVAVALPHVTAISLANALKRVLADIERDLDAAQEEARLSQEEAVKNGKK